MDLVKQPNVGRFLKALTADTLALCSGALSVPFAAIGAFWSNVPARTIFLALSGLAFLIATYRVWAHERQEGIRLSEENGRLKAALDDRPKPELFLGIAEDSFASGQRLEYFTIENRSSVSAVNVKFGLIGTGDVQLQFNPIPTLHNTGKQKAGYVLYHHGHAVPAGEDRFQQTIEVFCNDAAQLEVAFPLAISYQSTDGRGFQTTYEVKFSKAALWCFLTFQQQLTQASSPPQTDRSD